MSVNRMARVNELLRREISESLYPILAGEDVELATVTITEVDAAPPTCAMRASTSPSI